MKKVLLFLMVALCNCKETEVVKYKAAYAAEYKFSDDDLTEFNGLLTRDTMYSIESTVSLVLVHKRWIYNNEKCGCWKQISDWAGTYYALPLTGFPRNLASIKYVNIIDMKYAPDSSYIYKSEHPEIRYKRI